jgi:hypothetical protein
MGTLGEEARLHQLRLEIQSLRSGFGDGNIALPNKYLQMYDAPNALMFDSASNQMIYASIQQGLINDSASGILEYPLLPRTRRIAIYIPGIDELDSNTVDGDKYLKGRVFHIRIPFAPNINTVDSGTTYVNKTHSRYLCTGMVVDPEYKELYVVLRDFQGDFETSADGEWLVKVFRLDVVGNEGTVWKEGSDLFKPFDTTYSEVTNNNWNIFGQQPELLEQAEFYLGNTSLNEHKDVPFSSSDNTVTPFTGTDIFNTSIPAFTPLGIYKTSDTRKLMMGVKGVDGYDWIVFYNANRDKDGVELAANLKGVLDSTNTPEPVTIPDGTLRSTGSLATKFPVPVAIKPTIFWYTRDEVRDKLYNWPYVFKQTGASVGRDEPDYGEVVYGDGIFNQNNILNEGTAKSWPIGVNRGAQFIWSPLHHDDSRNVFYYCPTPCSQFGGTGSINANLDTHASSSYTKEVMVLDSLQPSTNGVIGRFGLQGNNTISCSLGFIQLKNGADNTVALKAKREYAPILRYTAYDGALYNLKTAESSTTSATDPGLSFYQLTEASIGDALSYKPLHTVDTPGDLVPRYLLGYRNLVFSETDSSFVEGGRAIYEVPASYNPNP